MVAMGPNCKEIGLLFADGSDAGNHSMREYIALAACGIEDSLPQSADLPHDVFTACLTTPVKMALRWLLKHSLYREMGVTVEMLDKIPGRASDRKTPLGELNWIFTAITGFLNFRGDGRI